MRKLFLICLIALPLVSLSQTGEGINLSEGIRAEWKEPEKVFDKAPVIETKEIPKEELASIERDKEFLKKLPKSYDNISPDKMKKLVKNFENQIERLTREKEALLKMGASQETIDSKTNTINALNKEREVVSLSIDKENLKVETGELKSERKTLRKYLIGILIILLILILAIIVLIQRKTIKVQDEEIDNQLKDINKKNSYLDHAARIIRHDMHSGINTYMPRGVSSLERRISEEDAKNLKIDGPMKMIKEGLAHTQKVYKSVYEFTNLVKPNSILEKKETDISQELEEYIINTSYKSQVKIEKMGSILVNPFLFCTAIDNLIRNGLKFNNSEEKLVKIFREEDEIVVEDNGIGLSNKEFKKIKENENRPGLGLNICIAIIEEHGFSISCEKLPKSGTRMKIKIKKNYD